MAKFSDVYVGKQLYCGTSFPDAKGPTALGLGAASINGSAYIAGPAIVGNSLTFVGPEASLMVSRCLNPHALALVPSIFKVSSRFNVPTPLDVVIGDLEGPVGVIMNAQMINATCLTTTTFICPKTTWVGAVSYVGLKTKAGKEIQAGFKSLFGKKVHTGSKNTNGKDTTTGLKVDAGKTVAPMQTAPVHVGRCTGNKKFDIKHPNKEGWRLSHVCVEGPTSDVYIRGKLDGDHVIDIPSYWQGLVDYDTITVNLTPFGRSDTSLHVKEITEDKIIISSDHLTQVKCFYHVYAERIDVEKNIPEYEGETPADYPGDVNQSSIAGYHYDVRED